MKKIKLLFLGSLMAISFNNANAQLSIGGDFSGIRGTSDGAEFMWGGMLSARFGITENIQIGANLGFYQKSFGEIFGTSVKARIIPVSASVEYFFMTDKIRPYAGLDLGLYSFGSIFGTTSSSESRFGLAPVAGTQYGINDNLYINVNAKYHLILDSDVDNLFSFNIGLGYKF